MAHTGIFATSDEILVKAGESYDTSITEARINALCLQAESLINIISRYNWSDAFAGLNADVKGILTDAESCYVASAIISFNMGGYTSRVEAETMLDFLRDCWERDINLLRDEKNKDFIVGA